MRKYVNGMKIARLCLVFIRNIYNLFVLLSIINMLSLLQINKTEDFPQSDKIYITKNKQFKVIKERFLLKLVLEYFFFCYCHTRMNQT